jgi:hypothetical protein
VQPLLGLAQVVDRAPDDDLAAVFQEHHEGVLQAEQPRPPLDDRQHVHPERLLHRGVLVELVEEHLGDGVPLELDHDPHALAVGLVTQVGDAVELALVHELGNALDQARLVHLEGDLRDDDRRAAALVVGFDRGPGAYREDAAAVAVGLPDRALAADEPCRGEVGARDVLHQLVDGELRLLEERDQSVAHLAQVVRRDVGRHPDGDSRGAVDEQVWHPAGQDDGLARRVVEVGDEVDGLAVDVGEERLGELREAALRVAISRGRVAVDRAEVPLPVDQWVAEVPPLREADESVVHGRIAVRVVPLQHLPHHAGALRVPPVVEEVLTEHRVEDAPVDGLEPVAGVGQRPPDDHRHRVVHVGLAHLVLDVDGDAVRLGLLVHGQMSRLRTLRALSSMNFRRGSTSSPMRVEKMSSASYASSIFTCRSVRVSGFIVVSQSCVGFISPRPL